MMNVIIRVLTGFSIFQKAQGIRKEYARNTQGVRKENARDTQGIRNVSALNTQGIRKEYARITKGIRKEYARNTQGIRKEYARNTQFAYFLAYPLPKTHYWTPYHLASLMDLGRPLCDQYLRVVELGISFWKHSRYCHVCHSFRNSTIGAFRNVFTTFVHLVREKGYLLFIVFCYY